MTVRERLEEAYNTLPKGYKEVAYRLYGCTQAYFKRITNGEPKDEAVYIQALKCVKLAAKKAKQETDAKVKKIQSI